MQGYLALSWFARDRLEMKLRPTDRIGKGLESDSTLEESRSSVLICDYMISLPLAALF